MCVTEFFMYFLTETYTCIVDAQKNRLNETVLLISIDHPKHVQTGG